MGKTLLRDETVPEAPSVDPAEIEKFRQTYRRECAQSGIDYVPLHTGMQFDKALTEYLVSRRARG